MNRFKAELDIQESSCSLIGSLGGDDRELEKMMADTDAIGQIIYAIKRHERAGLLHEKAYAALLLLLRKPEWGGNVDEDVIQLLMLSMDRNTNRTLLQQHGCSLVCLMCERGHETFLVEKGAIERIMTAMKTYLARMDLQKIACKGFQKLVFFDKNNIILRDDGVKLIVDCMVTYSENLEIQLMTMKTFNWLSMKPVFAEAIGKGGGIPALMGSVRANQSATELLEQALCCLMHLCDFKPNLDELRRRAGQTIVDMALKANPGRPMIWVPGSHLLNKLQTQQRHRQHVLDKVKVQVALEAMQQGAAEDWWLHAEAMEMCHILSRDSRFRDDLLPHKELPELMMKAAKFHVTNVEIQEMLVACASEMCMVDGHRQGFMAKGGERYIMDACMEHSGEKQVRSIFPIEEHGVIAFWYMQEPKKLQVLPRKLMESASPFLLGAIAKSPANGVLVEHAFLSIQKFLMSATKEVQDHYYSKSVVAHVLTAMQSHNGQLKTMESCVSILKNVAGCATFKDNVEQVPETVNILATLMRQYMSSPNIMVDGLATLTHFMERAESSKEAILENALDVLVSAMREYPVGDSRGISADMQRGCIQIIQQFVFLEKHLGTDFDDFMDLLEGGMRAFRSKMDLQINGARILRYCVLNGGNIEVFLKRTRHDEKNQWGYWDWYDHAGTLGSGLRTWVKSLALIQDITFLFRCLSEKPSLEMFLQEELMAPVVTALKTHVRDVQVNENVFAILANMLATPDLVAPLVEAGFCPIMFQALEMHAKEPNIIMIIFVIFQRLIAHDGTNRKILLESKAAQVIQNIVNAYAHEPTVQQQGMAAIQILFEGMQDFVPGQAPPKQLIN